MKKVSAIIDHLNLNPSYDTFLKVKSYRALMLFLPKSFTNGISFIYNKNNTLFFALMHEGYLQEFKNIQRDRANKYKQTFIKRKLNELIAIDETCRCIDADEIKAFVVKNAKKAQKDLKDTRVFFVERSYGTFKNDVENEKLHKMLEDIREHICSNQQ